jgi:Domain of unknown function (DUF4062)
MSSKRYQIFVSSTLKDLEEERKIALKIVLDLGHFPAGMEAFPATDDSSWELIKQVINDSDYYLVIVAGRYGSCDDQGLSYTEKEYNYAIELGKPAVAFMHGNPERLLSKNVEQDDDGKKKLERFKSRIQSARNLKFWTNELELQSAIYQAINHLIRTKPALGWTRQADGPNVDELNRRLVELQSKFDTCKAELDIVKNRQVSIDEVLSGEAKLTYRCSYQGPDGEKVHGETLEFCIGWRELFFVLAPKFAKCNQYWLQEIFDLIPKPIEPFNSTELVGDGDVVLAKFFSSELIVDHHVTTQREGFMGMAQLHTAQVWTLTDLGKKLYYAHIAANPQNE